MNSSIVVYINHIVQYATDYLMPILLIAFVLAVVARILISITGIVIISLAINFRYPNDTHHSILDLIFSVEDIQ